MGRSPRPQLALTKVEIPEVRYKADLEQLDRYTQLSSELLRLALAGIAAIGFLLGSLVSDKEKRFAALLGDPILRWSFVLAVVLLGLSAGLALLHRFLAADGMFYHIGAIKLLIHADTVDAASGVDAARERSSAVAGGSRTSAAEDETARNKRFKESGSYLGLSGLTLFLGAACLVSAFSRFLFIAR